VQQESENTAIEGDDFYVEVERPCVSGSQAEEKIKSKRFRDVRVKGKETTKTTS